MDQLRLFGMKAEQGRWLLILTGMLINLCLGSIDSWSVFVVAVLVVIGFAVAQLCHFTQILQIVEKYK